MALPLHFSLRRKQCNLKFHPGLKSQTTKGSRHVVLGDEKSFPEKMLLRGTGSLLNLSVMSTSWQTSTHGIDNLVSHWKTSFQTRIDACKGQGWLWLSELIILTSISCFRGSLLEYDSFIKDDSTLRKYPEMGCWKWVLDAKWTDSIWPNIF